MESIKVHYINIIVLILISIFNLISCFTNNMNIEKYIFYVIPFIVFTVIYSIFRNYKIDALLLIAAIPLSIFIGTWGNLTGAIFICFAFYCFNEDKKIIIITLICTLISIFLKMLLDKDGTISRAFNYIIGYSYIILIYYILIHPKK